MVGSAPDLLSSAVISSVILLLVSWIFKGPIRDWISARLRASIQHHYDEKLETYKAQLATQNETQLLRIKNEMEHQHFVYEALRSSFSEGQKSSMERKLDAVDQLWSEVLKLRNLLPPAMTFVDIFQEDEISKYKHFRSSREAAQIATTWSPQEYKEKLKSFNGAVEDIRPYIGEYLWAAYHAYRVIHMRLSVFLHSDENGMSALGWYNDEVNRGVIEAILDEEELNHFYRLRVGKYSWLQRTLEHKMLSQIRKIISGAKYLEDAREKLGMDALEKISAVQAKREDM